MTDHDAPPSTPTHTDPARNTPVEVDQRAIASIFEEEKLEYRIEGDGEGAIVRSGFVNAAIVLALDSDHLVFEALWRGELPTDSAAEVLFAVNEYNQTHFAPTLRFFETEQHLAVSGIRSLDITHGASHNQLGAFIVSSIEATLEAFQFLAQSFPAAVTWEEQN